MPHPERGTETNKPLNRTLGPIIRYWWLPVLGAFFVFTGKITIHDNPPASQSPVSAIFDSLRSHARLSPSDSTLTLYQLPHHPSLTMTPVIPMRTPDGQTLVSDNRYGALYDLFDLYETRQGLDDNFTLRVLDHRSGATLELFLLDSLRSAYQLAGTADWQEIDNVRRDITTDLVDKYEALGLPRDAIAVRWGRLNQVVEARKREEYYIAYEIHLAQMLNLSLLACEVGTVETFNQDHLVSRAGAKSRYQMMPDMLRRFGLNHHTQITASGSTITIRDERHPLLAMVPAFTLMRAFSNAVGHELAGLSAYHTGHNNIYRLLRAYLDTQANFSSDVGVLDAYVWALADGFDTVRRTSTFRTQSRGYVPALMGSLRAVEHDPIDFRKTMRAEMVALRPGEVLRLSTLLDALSSAGDQVDWGVFKGTAGMLAKFASLNPHVPLSLSDTALTPAFDIHFQTASSRKPVRLFLPPGSQNALQESLGSNFDWSSLVTYDPDLFSTEEGSSSSHWDRAYRALVDDVEHFGFSAGNRIQLEEIVEGLSSQAKKSPTLQNTITKDVAEIHLSLWASRYYRRLSDTVLATFGPDRKDYVSPADTTLRPPGPPVTK